MYTVALVCDVLFFSNMSSGSSSSSEYGSRNPDSVTTEAYSGGYVEDSEEFSNGSSHGTIEDFINQFRCAICLEAPDVDGALDLAPLRVAGETPAVTVSRGHVYLFCNTCQKFNHLQCAMSDNNTISIVNILSNTLLGNHCTYMCNGCCENEWTKDIMTWEMKAHFLHYVLSSRCLIETHFRCDGWIVYLYKI